MCRFASVVVTTLCLFLFLDTDRGAAQSTAATAPAGYDAAVDVAFEEFEAGNYAEARSRFLQAYELFPNARVLRALGKSEYELKNYLAAINYLEQALVSAVRPLTPQQRSDAQQLLERARGYVARYTIMTVPQQTTLRIDGSDVQPNPDGSVLLQVGQHVIEARATGFQTERRTVEVVGRADQVVQMELMALAPEPELVAPTPLVVNEPPIDSSPPAKAGTPLRRKWWFWTSIVGVVAAGAATGIVLSLRDPGVEPTSGGNSGVRIAVPSR